MCRSSTTYNYSHKQCVEQGFHTTVSCLTKHNTAILVISSDLENTDPDRISIGHNS